MRTLFIIVGVSVSLAVRLCAAEAPAERSANAGKKPPAAVKPVAKNSGMSLIPAGEFMMGSAESEGEADERPQHKVYSDAFYMDTREVTNAEYLKCVEAGACGKSEEAECFAWDNSEWKKGLPLSEELRKPDNPVVCVSWDQAAAYCAWSGKRLPTEAEWEKAARGGTATPWYFGDDAAALAGYAWYLGNSGKRTHPAGGKKPNKYGLYDIYGNADEWCADWFAWYDDPTPENGGILRNPQGAPSGTAHITRGGSWGSFDSNVRSAVRGSNPQPLTDQVGFRCVKTAAAEKKAKAGTGK
ncbi:MAG: SUMF1/EgtB/PvdO family nonheme iron enzyme [Elusimicrobia bacterium]|nr:SUMF1/EgtB/PvdO family nonheme iron enzyme [Elusimicrobiota bacterium]